MLPEAGRNLAAPLRTTDGTITALSANQCERSDEACTLRQYVRRLLQMRTVPTVRHQPRLAVAADLAGDDAELQLAAVLVVLALDRLHRHDDPRQPPVGVHRLEARRHPGIGPQGERTVGVVAVILHQALPQLARGE